MANELWSFYQSEMVNSKELKDQINQLQQQTVAEQELHASELQQLRDEKFQQQQYYARELQQLQQQQPEDKDLQDKVAQLEQELTQKHVVERQRDLLQQNLNLCWQRSSHCGLIECVLFFFLHLFPALHPEAAPAAVSPAGNWLGGQPPGPPPGPAPNAKIGLWLWSSRLWTKDLDRQATLQDLFFWAGVSAWYRACGLFLLLSLKAMNIVEP